MIDPNLKWQVLRAYKDAATPLTASQVSSIIGYPIASEVQKVIHALAQEGRLKLHYPGGIKYMKNVRGGSAKYEYVSPQPITPAQELLDKAKVYPPRPIEDVLKEIMSDDEKENALKTSQDGTLENGLRLIASIPNK